MPGGSRNCKRSCLYNKYTEDKAAWKLKNSEISQALPFLERQIQLVKPKIIVCLGSTAVQAIVDPKAKITELRGTWVERDSFKIMPTFHPSAVFRDEGKRQWLKRDLMEAGHMLKRIME
ncbi:uracil-DNA glycosylase family protein [Desulfitobacterium sp. Sab5]|uniref:uracil-DNA glycosylase family protein n=1 Tax=Desulfitobacterium nosdiversum TaxID=3375356 RepID=UPI003CF70D55